MNYLKTITSVILAVLVLVSSSSFTVNMHLCGGELQSVSIIEDAASCPMEVQLPPCHRNMAKQKSDCCQDSHLAFEGKDFNYAFKEFKDVITSGSEVSVILPYIMEVVETELVLTAADFLPYKPPIVQRDIPVLIQSFLI
jgi:hypothetical protein